MATSDSSAQGEFRGYESHASESNLPVPDPTRLTTQLVDRTFAGFREVFDVRFADLSKAMTVVTSQLDKLPAEYEAKASQLQAHIDRQVLALRELLMSQIDTVRGTSTERFQALDARFVERDARREQSAQDSRMSLDVALAAAKEAVAEQNKANTQSIAKSESSTQKQIDAMVQLMTSNNKSIEEKIADLKTRLDRGEGRSALSTEVKAEKRLDVGTLLQTVAVLITLIGLVFVAIHK